MSLPVRALVAAAALIVQAIPGGAETLTFAGAQVGSLPSTFEAALTGKGLMGLWTVVEDPDAEGGRALEQRTPDQTDYRFPLAIYTPLIGRDLEVAVRFKPIYGKIDQAGGLAVRLIDQNNYYVARANALENNVRFYRVVAGKREELRGVDTRVTSGEWHTLSLKAQGGTFVVGLDGQELFAVTDATFGGEGRVALWTKADSITRFGRIEIKKAD